MSEPLVYLNDRLVPASAAHVAIFDTGIVFGATVAEMTRTFRGRLFRLDDHLDRLYRALAHVGFDVGLSREELADISEKLVAHNATLSPPGSELGLIHFVTAGEHALYSGGSGRSPRTSPTVCAHTFPLPFAAWADRMRHGARLVTPAIRHVPPECYHPGMKYRSRLHFYLADQEARQADPQASALLLDLAGNVTETSAANFLMVKDGTIFSPTLGNTLPGVSRQTVIELVGRLGIPLIERDIPLAEALQAEEAWLTGTPYCMLPVATINGTTIGHRRPGPMLERVLSAWNELVGLDIRQQIISA